MPFANVRCASKDHARAAVQTRQYIRKTSLPADQWMKLAAVGAFAALTLAMPAQAQTLGRLAAEFDYFGAEKSTALEPPGIAIYNRTVTVPAGHNVLYVTLSTTGDGHDGAASCFTALRNGVFFNAGSQGAARCAGGGVTNVPGWVTLLKMPGTLADPPNGNCNDGGGGPGDCHDNAIYYTWCTRIPVSRVATNHTVRLRMATDSAGKSVFIEQAFFYVDSSRIVGPARCTKAVTPPSAADAEAQHDH